MWQDTTYRLRIHWERADATEVVVNIASTIAHRFALAAVLQPSIGQASRLITRFRAAVRHIVEQHFVPHTIPIERVFVP